MEIAVSGCGIAGSAVAHMLAGQGHEVTIFEQARQCRAVGAGIMLQPSGQKILDRLGILDSVTSQSACLLYTSPSPRDRQKSRMPSSA